MFVPRGLLHRFIPERRSRSTGCRSSAAAALHLPKQWRNEVGQLRMDAPYCHRDFRRPAFAGPLDEGMRELRGQARRRLPRLHATPHSPLDVVGWDGTVYPWAFPILNFQPRVGLVHLPPTWHGTFAARGALICSFVPRPVDFHPEAIPCPYPHAPSTATRSSSTADGNFTSRRAWARAASRTTRPGVPHGPHPGAYEGSMGAKTTELAVMLDTYHPLRATHRPLRRGPAYHASFLTPSSSDPRHT